MTAAAACACCGRVESSFKTLTHSEGFARRPKHFSRSAISPRRGRENRQRLGNPVNSDFVGAKIGCGFVRVRQFLPSTMVTPSEGHKKTRVRQLRWSATLPIARYSCWKVTPTPKKRSKTASRAPNSNNNRAIGCVADHRSWHTLRLWASFGRNNHEGGRYSCYAHKPPPYTPPPPRNPS